MSNSKINKVEMDCLAGALTLLEKNNIIETGLSEKTLSENGFEGLFELLDEIHGGGENDV